MNSTVIPARFVARTLYWMFLFSYEEGSSARICIPAAGTASEKLLELRGKRLAFRKSLNFKNSMTSCLRPKQEYLGEM